MSRSYATLIRAQVRSINSEYKTVTEKHRDQLTAVAALFTESEDITSDIQIRKAAWKVQAKDVKKGADPKALKASGPTRSMLKTVAILDVAGDYLKAWAGVQNDAGEWVTEPNYSITLREAYDALRTGKPRRVPSLQEALERAVARHEKVSGETWAVTANKDGSFEVSQAVE